MKEHGICAKCKKSVGCPYADDRIKGCKKFVLEDELELTNEEWLKHCNTEQLAEWIFQIFGEGVAFGETHGKTKLFPNDDIIHEGLVVEWLKQPHNSPK